jgi:hypothetical protein
MKFALDYILKLYIAFSYRACRSSINSSSNVAEIQLFDFPETKYRTKICNKIGLQSLSEAHFDVMHADWNARRNNFYYP